jgi:transcriptional regulator with XRE-family HTH domain
MPPVSTVRVNGPALRAIRKRRGLTLPQLAGKCGPHRHPQGIRKLETEDGKAASEAFVSEIARALKVDASEFTIAADGEPEPEPARGAAA